MLFRWRWLTGLAVAWGGLGLFLMWDAWHSRQVLGAVLGVIALVASAGNVVMARRARRREAILRRRAQAQAQGGGRVLPPRGRSA